MLSEFECESCGVKFVVAFTDDKCQPVQRCVHCGSEALKYIGHSDADMKARQEDIRDVFGIGQNVLVRSGKDWVTREILDITVFRHDTICLHCGMPLLGEPRFWFKDHGNIGLEDIMAVEDIDPHKLKKPVIPGAHPGVTFFGFQPSEPSESITKTGTDKPIITELTPEEKSEIRQRMVRMAPQFSADREIFMIELAGKEAQKKLMRWLIDEGFISPLLYMQLCKDLGIKEAKWLET